MIAVKFRCVREVYANEDFRVMSCMPFGKSNTTVDKRYKTFTISGSNIDWMKVGKQYECILVEDKKAKYTASYKLISRDANAEVKQVQADLIEIAGDYGYKEDEVDKLLVWYNSIDEFKTAIEADPYVVYMDRLGWGFIKADSLIMRKWSKWMMTYERCERLVVYLLTRDAEMHGNTRMGGSRLFQLCMNGYGACADKLMNVCENSPFIHYQSDIKMISLERYWRAEQTIADAIKSRLCETGQQWDNEQYREVSGFRCTDEQMQALDNARDCRVSILLGCAGTGKSQTTKSMIAMLEDNGMTYQLLAPTGIATKRLSDATERRASTIHRWLLAGDTMPLDYLVIDEFSMVGVELLASVLTDPRVDENTRLVFICDNAQLASISAGNIIQDMLDSHAIPTAELTRVFRYGKGGIATLATDVRHGDYDRVMDDTADDWDDLGCLPSEDDVVNQVVGEYGILLSSELNTNDILVLTPMKIGVCGSWRINNAIQERFSNGADTGFGYTLGTGVNAVKVKFRIGDKVINVKNNYHAMALRDGEIWENGIVVNGDIGYVREVYTSDEYGKVLIVDFGHSCICYTKRTIKQLQLGYALTCHKTQGQQAPYVIFLADGNSNGLLTRNLLYVAVTRAQRHLTIIGDCDTICSALERVENKSRQTNLKEMLK